MLARMRQANQIGSLVMCVAIALSACGGSSSDDDDDDVIATCGDGVTDGVEECDDGNQTDTDSCTSSCHDAVCGDGFVFATDEECDDGNTSDGDGCAATCVTETACGDGVLDEGEECDFADARCVGCAYAGACDKCEVAATECLDTTGAELQAGCFA